MVSGGIERERWGELGGAPVERFRLWTPAGGEARIASLGASLVSLRAPDRNGVPGETVLGLRDVQTHAAHRICPGSVVGRVANRVAGARFELDGRCIELAANAEGYQLHGGPEGFDRRIWHPEPLPDPDAPGLRLHLVSEDGDQGYPGRLEVRVAYRLSGCVSLRVELEARCDAPTVVNLAHHPYWNLRDGGRSPAADHVLQIEADHYTPTDDRILPTGAIADVAGTPLDFRSARSLAARAAELAGGYDHNFVTRDAGGASRRVASLSDPVSGRRLRIHTTQPGLQLYGGQHLPEGLPSAAGFSLGAGHGLCLEPQGLPDAVHHPGFPPWRLAPGEVYRHCIDYHLDTTDGPTP